MLLNGPLTTWNLLGSFAALIASSLSASLSCSLATKLKGRSFSNWLCVGRKGQGQGRKSSLPTDAITHLHLDDAPFSTDLPSDLVLEHHLFVHGLRDRSWHLIERRGC